LSAEIIMPKMGDAMTEGKVVRWYKKAGEEVKKGEPLLEIETDKVNLDLEAEADGTLGDVTAGEGQVVPVGGVLAKILGQGEKASGEPAPAPPPAKEKTSSEDVEPPRAEKEKAPAEAGAPSSAPQKTEQQARRATDKKETFKHTTGEYGEAIEMRGPRTDRTQAARTNVVAMPKSEAGGRRRSSPLARNMAQDLGVSLDSVEGSGPRGRIVADDVKKVSGAGKDRPAKAGAPSPLPPVQKLEQKDIPLSTMRRTIAKRLAQSTGPIPHFYLTVDYDVTKLMSVRQQVNDIEGVKTSVNDYIIRAAALALLHHPNVNASWGEEAITQHGEIHIGVAVATPEGLITPVIRNADQKWVTEIATDMRALAEKARNRKLRPEEYQGATFTISNLGAWGIEEFTAIINPPNAAILAIGAAEARAVVIDGEIVVRERMKVTMSCDHRVVDGATGAEYLRTLRQYIEQPLRLIL
jgi:pyruvate dehydrogenase E2 component (dihydrolipoamide acetyltransferase)